MWCVDQALAIPDTGEVFRQVRKMGILTRANKREARKMTRLKDVFSEVDDDASGFIDDEECVDLVSKLGKQITVDEAQVLIASAESGDGAAGAADGFLEFDEFCLMAEQLGCDYSVETEKEAKKREEEERKERDRRISVRVAGAVSLAALAELAGHSIEEVEEPTADELAEQAYQAVGQGPPEVPDRELMTPRGALAAEIDLWEKDITVLQHRVSTTVGLSAIKAKKQLGSLLQARDKKRVELELLQAQEATNAKAKAAFQAQREAMAAKLKEDHRREHEEMLRTMAALQTEGDEEIRRMKDRAERDRQEASTMLSQLEERLDNLSKEEEFTDDPDALAREKELIGLQKVRLAMEVREREAQAQAAANVLAEKEAAAHAAAEEKRKREEAEAGKLIADANAKEQATSPRSGRGGRAAGGRAGGGRAGSGGGAAGRGRGAGRGAAGKKEPVVKEPQEEAPAAEKEADARVSPKDAMGAPGVATAAPEEASVSPEEDAPAEEEAAAVEEAPKPQGPLCRVCKRRGLLQCETEEGIRVFESWFSPSLVEGQLPRELNPVNLRLKGGWGTHSPPCQIPVSPRYY